MFTFLKTAGALLFGGSEAGSKSTSNIMKVAEGVGTWIDERDFTEEEKSKANAANLAVILEAVKLTQNENSVRSITRRVLAWAIMGTYLLSFWIAAVSVYLEKDPSLLFQLLDKFMLPELALAVGSFYFMVSLIRSR